MIIKYKLGILWENDDEMYLIGTKEELETMANSIIHFINNPRNQSQLLGKKVFGTQVRLTEPLCTFSICDVILTESEQDKEEIINYFKVKVEGDSLPIDWKGRKEFDKKKLSQ